MIKFFTMILLFAAASCFAEDKFSMGLTAGYQHDTGMLSDKYGAQAHVQQNFSAGFVLKLDMSRMFLRSGAEYSYPMKKGKIINNSAGDVTGTAASFVEVPVYAGINLEVRDFGLFYIGGGGSYIFGTGYIKTAGDDVDISEQLFGYGLIAGIEYEIYGNASFLLEWEYMAARTSPVASTGGSYDDYYIDYSGQRIRFGAVYHFGRY